MEEFKQEQSISVYFGVGGVGSPWKDPQVGRPFKEAYNLLIPSHLVTDLQSCEISESHR